MGADGLLTGETANNNAEIPNFSGKTSNIEHGKWYAILLRLTPGAQWDRLEGLYTFQYPEHWRVQYRGLPKEISGRMSLNVVWNVCIF